MMGELKSILKDLENSTLPKCVFKCIVLLFILLCFRNVFTHLNDIVYTLALCVTVVLACLCCLYLLL